ncbi:hypothetical protein WJX81_007526 [Elliptochloris bilobata]|uniref:E2F-associated phosphoprotein n=1 Tax=Elliptochloris bilobata TaxID=381761 RepID=A0AAW1SM22_9CHLO
MPGTREDVPFYDPDLDNRDQAWVTKRRQGRPSDAILSCPGCLTSVCLDCQQHAEREGHFRAMFVSNCRVDYGRTVEPRAAGGRGRGKRRREQAGEPPPGQAQAPPTELFHPVECELCGAHLGVYEALEEVYHFYQVVASTA